MNDSIPALTPLKVTRLTKIVRKRDQMHQQPKRKQNRQAPVGKQSDQHKIDEIV